MNSKDVHMGEPTLKQMNREIEANKAAIEKLEAMIGGMALGVNSKRKPGRPKRDTTDGKED